MKKVLSFLLAVLLTWGAIPVFSALAEGQQAPDYLMEGCDSGASHVWEANLFFERMQEKTGVSFQFRQYTEADAWAERKKEIAKGNDLPDVLFKADLSPAETRDMAAAGVLIDLKPYLEEYAPDLWGLLNANEGEYLRAITLPDGTIPALPAISELPNNDLMWINTQWLKNLKLEMPETAEELTEVLRAFRDNDPNRNGKADEVPLTFIGMWELRFLGHAFGLVENDYYLSVRDGKVSSGLTTEENRAFLTWLHQLWEEKLLDHKGFTTIDSLRQITDSKAAIPYGLLLSNSPLTVVPSEALEQYAVLPPLAVNGTRVYRDLLGPLTRGTFAITSACKDPEKLVAWVNHLYTHEGSLLLQVGVEGEEYFWNEDGQWEWMDALETVANEVLPNRTLSDGGSAPGLVELDFQRKYADAATGTVIEQMAAVKDYAWTPCPPVFLSAEDEKTVAELQARIAPYAEQAMAEFVTGDKELTDENWKAFAEELEERGLPEMIAVWQKYME